MERIKNDVITYKIKMNDPQGVFIPKGTQENLTITIVDGFATFKFDHASVCKKFATFAIERQSPTSTEKTQYNERIQCAITKYEGKTKEEIFVILKTQLNKMHQNAQ